MAAVGRLLADLGAHVTHVRLSGVSGRLGPGPMIEDMRAAIAPALHGIDEQHADPASAD